MTMIFDPIWKNHTCGFQQMPTFKRLYLFLLQMDHIKFGILENHLMLRHKMAEKLVLQSKH